MDLVRIDSISRQEAAVCQDLQSRLKALGADLSVDDAGRAVGGDTGNLIARMTGDAAVAPMLLSAHIDTVEPGKGIEPVLKDGVFFSRGDTILGADDKCGVAIILEVLTAIKEQQLSHGPIEVVFSICEEVGLQGAKHLDFSQLTAKMGYVLDTRRIGVIITRAPAANKLTVRLEGKSAHAGAHPERGINAIALAAESLSRLTLGRIDHETTCNIGSINGGTAINIVPDRVIIEGEVRSHDAAKLDAVTADMVRSFEQAVDDYPPLESGHRPDLSIEVNRDFERLMIDTDHPVVQLARKAAENTGRTLTPSISGGGSDASVFFQHGIITGVLGTGCDKVHTLDEQVALADMVKSAQLLMEIIRLHARGQETD